MSVVDGGIRLIPIFAEVPCRRASNGATENAGPENAGPENDGPNRRA